MLDIVIGGALLGALFALIAVGLNLQYGVTRILNVAHGEFLMLGAFITHFFFTNYGMNPLLCIAISGPIVFILGFAIQNLVFRRIILISKTAGELEFRSLLACFGLMYVLQNVMREVFGSLPMSIAYLRESLMILGERFEMSRIVSAIIAVIISAVLYFVLRSTRFGLAIRSMVEEPIGAQLVGVNTLMMHSLTFGLGAFLAAVAGIMVGMIFTNLTPFAGPQYTFIALAIIVLGGLGSFIGSLVGGFIIGYIYFLTLKIESLLVMAVVYLFLVLFLVFKPKGLFGR